MNEITNINKHQKALIIYNVRLSNFMTATTKQIRASQEIINNNPSMRWDGKFGHYSNGQVEMTIHWDFDETKDEFKITLNTDGTQVYY